jgi:YVTN family beta-propeller protein
MKHTLRLTRITLAALSLAACCLLNCQNNSKLPTPILTGPDSGWVRATLRFQAHGPDGGPAGNNLTFSWGDGHGGFGPGGFEGFHEYAAPGTYEVTCKIYEFPDLGPQRESDPSEPHTIRILDDTLVFPDSFVSTPIQVGSADHLYACVVPDGSRLYVARAEADSVSVMETQTNSVVASVAVQDFPVSCVPSHSGDYVYVTNRQSGTVSVIRTSDNSVVHTIDAGYRLSSLALHPNDSLLYLGYADNSIVAVVHIDNDSLVARVEVGDVPSCIVAKPGGEYVCVISEAGKRVTVVRTADNTVVTSTNLSAGPVGCVFSPGGETAYVACSSGELALLRTTDLAVIGRVAYDSMGFGDLRYVAELPAGPCFYITETAGNGGLVGILRRSDNYLLRRFGFNGTYITGPVVALPDRSRSYVPTSIGVFLIGLRPAR